MVPVLKLWKSPVADLIDGIFGLVEDIDVQID